MRELLFRGKRYSPNDSQDRKDWVFGGVLQTDGNMSIIFTDVVNGTNAVYTDTLCQFSGRKDKKGTNIYEGDILETETGYWVVKFDQGAFLASCLSYRCLNYLFSLADCKVVGNIYDNPDIVRRYL